MNFDLSLLTNLENFAHNLDQINHCFQGKYFNLIIFNFDFVLFFFNYLKFIFLIDSDSDFQNLKTYFLKRYFFK